uniref:Ig-like domain-containing protein n=1 Tax=Ciona savignyi TaxID=51511 RepID=H2ZEU3_CIOSA
MSAMLSCSIDPNAAMRWQYDAGSVVVALTRHAVNSKQLTELASFIYPNDSLLINPITTKNGGYYSCYRNMELAMSYRMVVDVPGLLNINTAINYTIYLTLFIITTVFISTALAAIKSGLISNTKY